MDTLDVVVIGAGVVGLAVARALANAGREVVVLESESKFGSQASSRNSEVIHAGIYYPTGSLKAKTCVNGKKLLYQYCEERNIDYQRIGKVLVAVDTEEVSTLNEYVEQAVNNGVDDLRPLDLAELKEMEPEVKAVAAVLSPSTGIIDSHHFMLNLLGDLENSGGMLVCNSPVQGGKIGDGKLQLQIGGISAIEVQCNTVINCAGLQAPVLARAIGLPAEKVPNDYLARGHYFTLTGKSPFSRLIYPMPSRAGLGVHVTLDLGGQARFGPDVQWINDVDYGFPDGLEQPFRDAVARYYPNIQARQIEPGYSGIRAKIVGPGDSAGDFVIADHRLHGVDGLVNLFGIESPGLTASLALAEEVRNRIYI